MGIHRSAAAVIKELLQVKLDNLVNVHRMSLNLSREVDVQHTAGPPALAHSCPHQFDSSEMYQDDLRSDSLTWSSLDVSTGGTVS